MINIYCLVDPRTDKPFYVGATMQTLKQRLHAHWNDMRIFPRKNWSDKMRFINDIRADGFKPKAVLLFVATLHNVDYYECLYQNILIEQGYNIISDPTSSIYSKKMATQKNNLALRRIKSQPVKKYMQLRYNNILIIIW